MSEHAKDLLKENIVFVDPKEHEEQDLCIGYEKEMFNINKEKIILRQKVYTLLRRAWRAYIDLSTYEYTCIYENDIFLLLSLLNFNFFFFFLNNE